MWLETFIDIKTGAELYSIVKVEYSDGTSYKLYDYWNNKVIYESTDLQEVKTLGYNLTQEFNSITDKEIEDFIDKQNKGVK